MNIVPPIIVLMGVSGVGKTTVGRALAERLGYAFHDGDDFHPPENVAKMAAGEPLQDADRRPWLAKLHRLIVSSIRQGKTAVVACSALKRDYRRQLAGGTPAVTFVFLQGSYALIEARMRAREDHFMGAQMLRSQFETLEAPRADEALVVNVDKASVEQIVERIVVALDD